VVDRAAGAPYLGPMATRFSFWAAPFLLAPGLLLGLTAGGCVLIGQSGGSPGCSGTLHCACANDFSHRIRGRVLSTDGERAEVLVLELPDGIGEHRALAVGTVIGGEVWGCETPPDYAVGDELWVLNYSKGQQDPYSCPYLEECFVERKLWEECAEDTREACAVYMKEALRHGYLTLVVESGGYYDLGVAATGPVMLAIDEIDTLSDLQTCSAWYPPPPVEGTCDDMGGGGFFSWAW